MQKIRKAVILAAGHGTRFLPETKAIPKEMLPIVDKPVIQYVVEELVEAGIEQIIFVTNPHKKTIEKYFSSFPELEKRLKAGGKHEELKMVTETTEMADFKFVLQDEPKGTGDAILKAKDLVGDEPFIVMFGDDFIIGEPSRTEQMIEAYEKYGGVILSAIRTTNPEDATRYAFAKGEEKDGAIEISDLIEKPGIENKPSDLAVVSGYIFPSEMMSALEQIKPSANGEYLYVDGVNYLREQGTPAYAVEIKNAKYYDCGNITEYLKTNVELGLKRPDIAPEFGSFIKDIAKKL